MRKLLLALFTALLLPVGASAQGPPPPPNPQMNARREALQRQIVGRFMDHVTRQLGLDAATRTKLEQQMRASGEQRGALARSTADLRMKMMGAVRDSTVRDSDFNRMLSDLTTLRQREEDLWKADQKALSRILTPRQQVQFVFMWLRFNEQVREMAMQRPGMRPPR